MADSEKTPLEVASMKHLSKPCNRRIWPFNAEIFKRLEPTNAIMLCKVNKKGWTFLEIVNKGEAHL